MCRDSLNSQEPEMNSRVLSRLTAVAAAVVAGSTSLLAQLPISASPGSFNFSYVNGTTTPISQSVQVTAPVASSYTVSLSPSNLAFYVNVPGSGQTNQPLTVTLTYPQ